MASANATPQAFLDGERRRAWVRVVPAGIVFLVAAWSQISLCNRAASVVPKSDWEAAVAAVESKRSPEDLIVFAPTWVEPLGRHYFGHLMTIDMVARADAAGYARIWEVSAYGESARETRGLEVIGSEQFGTLLVTQFQQVPSRIAYDFAARVRDARVTGQAARGPLVGVEEVGFEPHRCALVIPKPGQTVSLHFGQVPLGTEIVGYVGLADVFTRRDIRAPGRLELLVDGTSVATVTAGVDDGWLRFASTTRPGAGEVELRLTAVGEGARDRRLCFAMEARE